MRRLTKNSAGQVIILAAVAQVVLCGMVALAIDAGFLYDLRRRAQIAADAGAVGGALEILRDSGMAHGLLEIRARAETSINNFTHGTAGVTVTVNRPPQSGYYAGNTGYVEVIVERPASTYFMRVLGRTSATVRARAVAGVGNALGCLYALKKTSTTDEVLEVANTKIVTAPNCDFYVNSRGKVDGTLTVRSLNTRDGTITGTGTIIGQVNVNQPIVADPLAHIQWPTSKFASCSGELKILASQTIVADDTKCWDKILVETTQPVTFTGGSFYAKSEINFKGLSNVTGRGVTFFVEAGDFIISGGAGTFVDLESPTTGANTGMLVFVKRDSTEGSGSGKKIIIGNDADVRLQGVIYTRDGLLEFGSKATGDVSYSILVAHQIKLADKGEVKFNSSWGSVNSPIRRATLGE